MMEDGIKIGIAPINWCNDDIPELGGDIPLERCLSEMRAAGYVGTELGHKFPTGERELIALLNENQLALASAWQSTFFVQNSDHNAELSRFEQRVQLLSAVGAKLVNLAECSGTVHNKMNVPLSQRPVFTDSQWKRLVEGLNRAGEICRTHGLRAAYHHHMGTGVQTLAEIERLMQATDPDLVFLCADTGHLYLAGADPFAVFETYSDRIAHIHLKDVREKVFLEMKTKDRSFLQSVLAGIFTVPGDGTINFEPLLNRVQKSGYQGWLIVEAEQDPEKANPFQYAQLARQYIYNSLSSERP